MYEHTANDVRQTAVHVAEPLVFLILWWLLNSCNIMSLQQERFKQQGGQCIVGSINWFIVFGLRKNCSTVAAVSHCTYLYEVW